MMDAEMERAARQADEECKPTMLTREQILGADDLLREEVDVPEWGGVVFVRTMTGTERDVWNDRATGEDGKRDMTDFSARLCVACVVKEDGTRIFSDSDAPRLGAKSGKMLNKAFLVAARLNGFDGEDTVKNSGTTPSASPGSD